MKILLMICLFAPAVLAQTPAPPPTPAAKVEFEAASVKPNKSGETNSRIGMSPGGRMNATNVTLRQLILSAYNLRPFQLTGGPGWLGSERFDIAATVGHEVRPEAGGPPAEIIQMVKHLLADRFKLVAHIETKEMPVYHLVLARSDGKPGPQLTRSDIDCDALARAGTSPPPGPATAASQGRPIGACSQRIGGGMLAARSATMDRLARSFGGLVDRLVVDKTGLSGSFDVDLTWTPDPTADTTGPSIFTALQEQLGLKLEASRGPVEMLVIDSVERPIAD